MGTLGAHRLEACILAAELPFLEVGRLGLAVARRVEAALRNQKVARPYLEVARLRLEVVQSLNLEAQVPYLVAAPYLDAVLCPYQVVVPCLAAVLGMEAVHLAAYQEVFPYQAVVRRSLAVGRRSLAVARRSLAALSPDQAEVPRSLAAVLEADRNLEEVLPALHNLVVVLLAVGHNLAAVRHILGAVG